MSGRKRVPRGIEQRVLWQSARRCCICFRLHQDFDVKLGQIAHLDHDPSNSAEDNVAFLCMEHHTLYDSPPRQHKGFTINELKAARAKLYVRVRREEEQQEQWVLVLHGTVRNGRKKEAQVIAKHLRRILKDSQLTIERLQQGSVRVYVKSSKRAFDEINSLVERGELQKIGKFEIKGPAERPLLVHHVARLLGMSERTVRFFARQGHLAGFRDPAAPKVWRFWRADVEKFQAPK